MQRLGSLDLLIALITLMIALPLSAQEVCGTRWLSPEHREAYLERQQTIMQGTADGSRASTPTYIQHIPVKVHIVTQGNGSGGYAASGLATEFDRLNSSFASSSLQFYICAINHVSSDIYYTIDNDAEKSSLATSSMNDTNVVNLFIVNEIADGGNGFATLPPSTGFLCLKASRMSETTLEHEMGHVFGLLHTHGMEWTAAELANGSNCATAGDLICDTPADPGLGSISWCCPFGCVSVVGCSYIGVCADANGDDYDPPISNFMSYAPGGCRTTFSSDQRTLMYGFAADSTSRSFSCAGCMSNSLDLPPVIPQPFGTDQYYAGEFWKHALITSSTDMAALSPVVNAPSTWYATEKIRLLPGFRVLSTQSIQFKGIISPCP